jgi:hypothetical protein
MFVINDLGEQIMREIDASSRQFEVRAINLYPPGGFRGQLPQAQVSFDPIESVDGTIPASGLNLIINLNRIRSGDALGDGVILARHLASGIIVPTEAQITVQGEGGVPSYTGITTVVFPEGEFELLETGRLQVTFSGVLVDEFNTLFSGLMVTGSGITARDWYLNGAIVSGISLPDGTRFLPNGGIVAGVASLAPYYGTTDLTYTLIGSLDGSTWEDLHTYTHAGSSVLSLDTSAYTISSGTFVGIRIDGSPELPDDLYSDITIVLKTLEMGGEGGGGSLPTFTPKRIPFADNTTGLLTESARFNYSKESNGDILIIGADDFTHLGGESEKVGVYIVRDGHDGGFVQETFSSEGYTPNFAGLKARGSRESPEPILLNDVIFRFTGRGYTTAGWALAPQFRLEGRATEDWTGTAQGTKAVIGITKLGETTTTDMLQITDTGLASQGSVTANDTLIGDSLQIIDGATTGYVLTAADNDGNAVWAAATGGNGTKYNPDLPPSSPSSYDDEFDDNSLSGLWTADTYDVYFDFQETSGSRHLSTELMKSYLTLQGGWDTTGDDLYQAFAPAENSWAIVAKVGAACQSGLNDSYLTFGISTNDPTDYYYQSRVGYFNGFGVRTVYNDGGGATEGVNCLIPFTGDVYIGIIKVQTETENLFSTYVSANGQTWTCIEANRSLANLYTGNITRLYFGLGGQFVGGVYTVDFVRYFNTPSLLTIGSNP